MKAKEECFFPDFKTKKKLLLNDDVTIRAGMEQLIV